METRAWFYPTFPATLVLRSRLVGSDLHTCHRFWPDYGLCGSYPSKHGARRYFLFTDHLAASGASRERVRSTLFSARGTDRSHVGTPHRKVLDFAYLEDSH